MKYAHIIWDFNGTIIDDVSLGVDVFNKLRADCGLEPIDKTEYVENFKIPVRDFYEDMGFDFSKVDFRKIGERFVELYSSKRFECPLIYGVADAVRTFSKIGVGQSVLSAYENGLLHQAISHYGLSDYFGRIDGLDNIDAGSKIELGKRHIAAIGESPEMVVMVGDTPHDKQVADAMGVACALVACGHTSRRRLEKVGAPVFENPAEFKEAFLSGDF